MVLASLGLTLTLRRGEESGNGRRLGFVMTPHLIFFSENKWILCFRGCIIVDGDILQKGEKTGGPDSPIAPRSENVIFRENSMCSQCTCDVFVVAKLQKSAVLLICKGEIAELKGDISPTSIFQPGPAFIFRDCYLKRQSSIDFFSNIADPPSDPGP